MKKKGFTLIELLAVIAILTVVFSITVPVVTSILSNSKKSNYNSQVDLIIESAKNYTKENKRAMGLNEPGDFITLYLNTSKKIGSLSVGLSNTEFIKKDIKDPLYGDNNTVKKGYIPDDFEVVASVDNNSNVVYDYYNPSSDLKLNVPATQRAALNSGGGVFNVKNSNITAKYNSTDVTSKIVAYDAVTGNVITTLPTNTTKVYNVKYVVEHQGLKQIRYSKIYIGNFLAPTITLIGATTIYHQVNTPFIIPFDVDAKDSLGNIIGKNDITVTSTVNSIKTGSYTLTYKVTDQISGLSTSVNRTVTVRTTP